MKMRFVMLLIDFWDCKIDCKCEKNEKVKKSYLIVKRDKRDDFDVMTDFKTISIHDNVFFDVAIDVTNEKVDDSINVEKIAIDETNAIDVIDDINNVTNVENFAIDVWNDDIDVTNVNENETNEINEITMMIAENEKNFFDFLQCLMRTCSCNLMLLKYFSKQRLQKNAFVFSFAIRVFSTTRCFACRVFLFWYWIHCSRVSSKLSSSKFDEIM